MFIFTFHLGRVLHNRLSTSGAWGAITTVNGTWTRSGFRDKKKVDFLISCIHYSGVSVQLALSESLWTGEECELHGGRRGGKLLLFTPTLKVTVRRWYQRMQTCITLLKSDKWIRAVKAFCVKCLVFIRLDRLLPSRKGLLLSMKVVTAWATLWEQPGRPGHGCTDVEGWRWEEICETILSSLNEKLPSGPRGE